MRTVLLIAGRGQLVRNFEQYFLEINTAFLACVGGIEGWMEVLQRNILVVNGLLSHMFCSILDGRRKLDAIIHSSIGSTGEVSLSNGGSLIV